MERIEMIDAVGRKYHTSNIENGEFSYPKAFKEKNLDFEPIKKKKGKGSWQFLDIRFELNGVTLLIETKNDADKWPTVEEQIAAYVEYEKRLTGNKIIAIFEQRPRPGNNLVNGLFCNAVYFLATKKMRWKSRIQKMLP